jgi:hypothetical protein
MFLSFPANPSDTSLEIALDAAQTFVHDSIWCITFAIAFTYYMGQEIGKGFYKVRQAASEIELEDLQGPIAPSNPVVKPPDLQALTVKALKALCKAHSIIFKSKVTKFPANRFTRFLEAIAAGLLS